MERNVYIKNYNKYVRLLESFPGGDYDDFSKYMSEHAVPLINDGTEKKAMVLFGFSGNGKSTWIKNFQKDNGDYLILSMDYVVKSATEVKGSALSSEEIIRYFSNALDYVVSRGCNVIIDGNFLNFVTRMILVDSLHTHGYDVSLVDITPIFDVTLERRIMDVASRLIGSPVTVENVDSYRTDPRYLAAKQNVMEYHEKERHNACYDEQILLGLTSFGVERVITVDTPKQGSVGGIKK